MYNQITLIGNLGKDPEIKHLEGNRMVAQFSVATNESYKDKQGNWQTKTTWHDIVLWGLMAEKAEKQFRKGSQVFIVGKMTNREYEDKDGIKRRRYEVVGDNARLLGGSGGEKEQTTSAENNNAPEPEDDLPF